MSVACRFPEEGGNIANNNFLSGVLDNGCMGIVYYFRIQAFYVFHILFRLVVFGLRICLYISLLYTFYQSI